MAKVCPDKTAAPQILEAVCLALQFEVGEFWSFEREEKVLHFKNYWHLPSPETEIFLEASRVFEFANGEGLPGQDSRAADSRSGLSGSSV